MNFNTAKILAIIFVDCSDWNQQKLEVRTDSIYLATTLANKLPCNKYTTLLDHMTHKCHSDTNHAGIL